ncbi:MAG TPA: helix-turn-helix domain-containing protein [Acetobacteraceae bacterium]|jgi:AcrR family transcriptional regulator|nr:helix-turn-helix domain-containing protein [Acetobacteraceae bacterium]
MGRPKFSNADFLGAALAIASEHGPSAVTVASISERLRAPTGSFYHRFASRNVLLGALWLRTVLDFRRGVSAAVDAGDGLRAALHTPAWARAHLDEARLLLLYHRDDFVQGEWPEELRERVAAMTEGMRSGAERFARLVFGHDGEEEIHIGLFLLAEVPVAAVRAHLLRREPPPPLVDRLIRVTYRAVVADYRRTSRSHSAD